MSTLSLLTSREPTRCPQCKHATTWRKRLDTDTSECALCGFVMDRYLMQQANTAAVLTDAIKEKMGHNQALAEWKRMREMYPAFGGLKPAPVEPPRPQMLPPKPQWEVVYSGPSKPPDGFVFNATFNPPPLPKPQETIAYSGGPLDGDVAKYVEGGPTRIQLHWPAGAFYVLERIDTVWTWVYYGDEDVP